MTVIANPAALSAREQRRAERAAYLTARAEREADADQHTDAPSDVWDDPDTWDDQPIPYVPAGDPLAPPVDDWRAALAPAAVMLSPVALHALHAAVRATTTAPRENLPTLEVARLTVGAGRAQILATDRYRVHALSLPVEGAADAEGFVTPKDLGAVVSALAPSSSRRGADATVPTIAVTVDPDARTITWEAPGARHVTTWDEYLGDYPPAEHFLSSPVGHSPADAWHANPRFVADAMAAAAVVDERVHVGADRAKPDQAPMVRVTAGDREAAAGEFRAAIMSVRV